MAPRLTFETPIEVRNGDTFSISLEIDEELGYDWTASEYSPVTLSLLSETVADGYRTFIFFARSKGETQLIFDNTDSNDTVLAQREYTIIVPIERTTYTYGPNIIGNAQLEL